MDKVHKKKLNDDKSATKYEDVGIDDDSGFASIAGSSAEAPVLDDSEKSVKDQDIKFKTLKITKEEQTAKRKLKNETERLAEEKYAKEKRELIYKRLMHLLNKSKFYSTYIVEKLNTDVTAKSMTRKTNTEQTSNDKATKTVKIRKEKEKYNINEYVSSDMKLKLRNQNSKNQTQEETETDFNNDTKVKKEQNVDNSVPFVQPLYFKGDLRAYQKDGLQWLKVLYENGVNGILADEMGLGKTIQVIALFCHLLENRQDGPYLIIAPLSTIPNWTMEFERFASNLPVVVLHGKPEVRQALVKKINRKHPITNDYSTFPIVLTTYEIPLVEKLFMSRTKWRYIVIDEGHRIKNHECQLVGVLRNCRSMNRLLLTGTPLQNNLVELWSLLNFLLPEIFDDLAVFESWFSASDLQNKDGTQKVLEQEEEKHILSTLREILKPFMLRRIKDDVCLDIPPRKELIVYAPMTELQHDLYRAVLDRDLHVLSKVHDDEIEMSTKTGARPKRSCLKRNKYSSTYVNMENTSSEVPSRSPTPLSEDSENTFDSTSYFSNHMDYSMDTASKNKHLDHWKQFATINERNVHFLIRIKMGNSSTIYKQIVNHPFLVHCPLDNAGLPEISENLVKASGKLLVLDLMLAKLKPRGHKILLFSTWTMILDLLADYLSMRHYNFLMLDGRHSVTTRQENIKLFNEDPNIFIFLISTRAGGVGLNLASADTVIIYDSDWNPQADLQAMARCHRIGQTRPVVVYRLCTKGTIDERIIHRAEAKRKLEKMVISKQTALNLNDKNTILELKRLLESTDSTVVSAESEIYTDEEMDQILDRSDLYKEK